MGKHSLALIIPKGIAKREELNAGDVVKVDISKEKKIDAFGMFRGAPSFSKKAAEIRHEIRKKVKDFGLIDAILVAKRNELKCKIVSGDKHFKGMKDIIYIGE